MSDAQKAAAAVNYVNGQVTYSTDTLTYGVADYWMDPRGVIYYEAGDCEDMAFFVHSLLVNGDVPSSRLRTYFGYYGGIGHSWVAYRRTSDDEWVILDATAGTISDVDSLPLAKNNSSYYDAWAYLTTEAYVEIPSGLYLQSYENSEAALTLPSLRCSAVGFRAWDGAVTLPELSCSAYGASRGALTLPALTFSGTGITGSIDNAAITFPPLRISASGLSGTISTASLTLKALSCSAAGYGVPVGTAALSLPSLVCAGELVGDRFTGYTLRYNRSTMA